MSEDNIELPIECQEFDDEFSSLIDYARMYRSLGLQVVPAMSPSSGKNWKRPALPSWKEFTHKLASDDQFEQWFIGHPNLTNIGLLTGPCSKNLFIIDLDTHKNPHAMIWWEGIHSDHNMGIMSETPTQRTGGGGLQMLFFAPEGWTPPTIKTSIGVDIRGVGGFAVVAPSKHEMKGSEYSWLPGQEPYTLPIAVSTIWMCQAVDELASKFGGHVTTSSGERVRTETPQHSTDEWGKITDGREDRMYRMIFRACLDMYRDSPISPTESEQREVMKRLFEEYVDDVETRIKEPGTEKHILLEREGRGITLFRQKWRSTIRQWDTKIAKEAAIPWQSENLYKKEEGFHSKEEDPFTEPQRRFSVDEPGKDPNIFNLLRTGDIMTMPEPDYLVEGVIPSESFGFVIGVPGCLKSFLTLDLSLSVAAGLKEWMGYKIKKNGPVVYVTSEGLGDIKNRIKAWEKKTKKKVADLPFYLIPDSMNMMGKQDVLKLARTVKTVQDKEGSAPCLIVIDTASRVLPGADENLQKDMTMFVKACDYLRESFSCAILAVHHMSRNNNGTMRGSTVFDGAADFILLVERESGQMVGTITAKKIKAAADGWTIDFSVTEVTLDEFGTKTSLHVSRVVAHNKGPDVGFGAHQETGYIFAAAVKMSIEERDEILKAANEAWNLGEPWSISSQSKYTPRYATRGISKVLKKRIKNDSHALLVASAFVDLGYWKNEEKDSHTKLKGLKVSNVYQNGTENMRKSENAENANFRRNYE